MADKTYENIKIEREGNVTIVSLNRPEKRNAVDGPMAKALLQAFAAFEANPEQRVAVLHGEHGVFCAGADLSSGGATVDYWVYSKAKGGLQNASQPDLTSAEGAC